MGDERLWAGVLIGAIGLGLVSIAEMAPAGARLAGRIPRLLGVALVVAGVLVVVSAYR